jgi:hypothetical protein
VVAQLIQPHEAEKIAAVDEIENQHPMRVQLESEYRALTRTASFKAISTACNRSYRAVKNSGRRPLSVIDLMVIHCTQGFTAEAAASWFKNKLAMGSAHKVSDDNECFSCLDDDQIPWGAPGANYHGMHFEQAGYVTWTQVLWSRKHRNTVKRTAYKVALHCKKYGVRRRWLVAKQLAAGIRDGITDHMQCTLAFGGNHTDPGLTYPRKLFMFFVHFYYLRVRVRRIV